MIDLRWRDQLVTHRTLPRNAVAGGTKAAAEPMLGRCPGVALEAKQALEAVDDVKEKVEE